MNLLIRLVVLILVLVFLLGILAVTFWAKDRFGLSRSEQALVFVGGLALMAVGAGIAAFSGLTTREKQDYLAVVGIGILASALAWWWLW